MASSVEQLELRAPAAVWRGVGALAISLANTSHIPPEQEESDGEVFDTWQKNWINGDDGDFSYRKLRIRSAPGGKSLATLYVLGPKDTETGLNTYTRYFFSADAQQQDDSGYLAVFRGAIDPNDPKDRGGIEKQQQQYEIELSRGTARGTMDDLGQLLVILAQSAEYIDK